MLESLIITGASLVALRMIPETIAAICQLFAKPATHRYGWMQIDYHKD